MHGQGEVSRQGPRGRGPGQGLNPGQRLGNFGFTGKNAEAYGNGLVLTVLVNIVIHPQFVVGQWSFVFPTVGQHAETLVGQPLVRELFESPDHRLHELHVQGLVVIFEVDPACLSVDIFLPLIGIFHHRTAAGVVELVDTHGFDLLLVGHAQLLHRFELGR